MSPFSRGVLQVQNQLEENGNGLPEFDLSLITAFLVTERISSIGAELERKAIKQGFLVVKESEVSYQKPSSMTENESETVMEEFKNPQNWGKMNKNLHSQQYYIRTSNLVTPFISHRFLLLLL